ncbi:MipA/OmpV family protein [Micavibrio aeruginosavorus]|uniref:MipA/OmpV family protein n=1 Tax=Micavibrio aeruginosavorus TaxID=349221 RepID=UPI0005A14D88|nr:MipA/OmpV family protein [Micavibrio aeruginosavorus]
MLKPLNISAAAAVGIFSFVIAGSANAQQWINTTQQATPVSTTQQVEPDNWNYTVGGGIGYAPTYEGSDEYDALPVPVLNVEYKDGLFFANVRNGIGSYPLRGENYKVGASIGYAPGREEDEDEKNLRGMGDVEASATANLLAEYDFGFAQLNGKVTTAASGDYGTTAEVNLGSRYPLSEKIIMSGSVGTVWADEEHMKNRFGVSGVQSAASGYSQYEAESGVKSVGFSVGATYLLTDRWNANLTFRGDKLMSKAADSPVVKDDFVPAVFLTTSYKF